MTVRAGGQQTTTAVRAGRIAGLGPASGTHGRIGSGTQGTNQRDKVCVPSCPLASACPRPAATTSHVRHTLVYILAGKGKNMVRLERI